MNGPQAPQSDSAQSGGRIEPTSLPAAMHSAVQSNAKILVALCNRTDDAGKLSQKVLVQTALSALVFANASLRAAVALCTAVARRIGRCRRAMVS